MDKVAARFGFWCALTAFVAAAGYSVVQILQVLGLVGAPWDAIFIYAFSFGIAWPFMLAIWALHRVTRESRQLWSGAALLFAVIYSVYVCLMYAVQLGTAIPLALRGTPNALFAVDRYSLFWAIDGLGYICMGFSTLFAAGAFERNEIWTRHFFVANGLFTSVIAFIYFYPVFSVQLLLLGTPWILTAPGSILLLALRFARERRGAQSGLLLRR